MPRLLIIADDLSGAADAAGAASGDSVVVLAGGPLPDADIVAIDIDSRQTDPASARDRAAAAASAAAGTVYHKIDSLLRGNWPFELQGILQGLAKTGRRPLALIAPAWPERARTTVDGRVWLNGAPLSSSTMRDDAGRPLDGDIAGRLAEAGLSSARLAGQSLDHLPEVDALVCDAGDRADLDRIATMAATASRPMLCVGSGGLVSSIARTLRLPATAPGTIAATGPVLIVVGSASELSRRQVLALRDIGTAVLRVTPGITPDLYTIDRLLRSQRDVVLAFEPAGRAGLDTAVVAELAAALAPLLPRLHGLILTGGETARAVLVAAGVRAIRMLGEVEPGVPIGVTLHSALPVITKAGAFGDDHTLRRALAALRPSARPT